MPELSFRTATEADLERVIAIHGTAFPDPRPGVERRRNFTQNALGTIDDLWLAVRDGLIVGHAFRFRLEAWFGGKPVAMGAIASVGVAPEARGHGIASLLLGRLHEASLRDGAAISVLYPFKQGFYARHGYAPTAPSTRWTFAPEAVPGAWVKEGRAMNPHAPTASAPLEALYEKVALTHSGWLRRPRALWDAQWLDERVHVVVVGAPEPRGYVAFSYAQAEPHARTRIEVRDLVAVDDAARRALVGVLGAQRDQVAAIELDLPSADPLALALLDPDRREHGDALVEHRLATVVGGPMIRVLDLDRALAQRGYVHNASISVKLGWRTARLTSRAGSVVATESRDAEVVIAEAWVPSVLFGGIAPSALARLGYAEGEPRALAEADALFELPPFSVMDRF